MKDIHMVWIGDSLSLLEQLSIKLYQKQKLQANLWCYDTPTNVPEHTIIRDAEEILSKDSLFRYRNENYGSSISHWSDRFQLTLLQKYGGWYSQLDVACLNFPEERDYHFISHPNTIVDVCVMKTPKEAPFITDCLNELKEKINQKTNCHFDWEASMRIIGNHITNANLSNYISSNAHGRGHALYMRNENILPPVGLEFIHWWNGQCDNIKNTPKPGTFYHKLLLENNLIK